MQTASKPPFFVRFLYALCPKNGELGGLILWKFCLEGVCKKFLITKNETKFWKKYQAKKYKKR
ncbi:hypothetical protein DB41_II00080 [Neochlamydia sp. TUME1]|nr:hypothetical protein DB41_II00080 [Neochlamydia sp. TUME1]